MAGRNEHTKRAQFDFSPETWNVLDTIKERIKASTNAEVIRRAIAMYSWFTEQIEEDYIVEVKDKDDKLIYRMKGKFFKF